jgi:uncharacterized coiled-coil protein SlyX
MKSVFVTLLVLLFISCHKDSGVIKELDRIKTIGDTNSVEALSLLDSIRPYAANSSQYAQMKYDLLTVRISDKALIVSESDSLIKRVLPYFIKNGSTKEKQETYYYAGSVYRDLEDYPRSLSYFLKAKDVCEEGYDTVMLRNTYSNLAFIYFSTQDFLNAVAMAKENCRLSKKIGDLSPEDLNQFGVSQMEATKEKGREKAGSIFEASFRLLKRQWKSMETSERLYQTAKLLQYFCYTDRKELADECYNLLNRDFPEWPEDDMQKFILIQYYIVQNKLADAALLLEKGRSECADINYRYDYTKYLSLVYSAMHNTEKAAYYGDEFRKISDTVDFGKRQVLSATVNNQYKYYKEKDAEMQLIRKTEDLRIKIILVICTSFLFVVLVALLYFRKKNKFLKKLVETETTLKQVKESIREKESQLTKQEDRITHLNSELDKVQTTKAVLEENLNSQTKEIASMQESLDSMVMEKTSLEKEMQKVKAELEGHFEETKKKKELLAGFMQAYFLSESKLKDEEFSNIMQRVADYGTPMTEAYWKKLYAVVDEQSPDFSRKVREHIQPFSDEKVKYCYLIRYGMKGPQIMHVMNTKSSTHYRRMEELSWVWM